MLYRCSHCNAVYYFEIHDITGWLPLTCCPRLARDTLIPVTITIDTYETSMFGGELTETKSDIVITSPERKPPSQ